MHFSKEQKKYFLAELKGTITNNFNFTSKGLNQVSALLQEPPILCSKCKLPLIASICSICKTDNELPAETQFKQNFAYRQKMQQQAKMQQSMILLVDMSGSMVCSYRSKYQKVNEDFVKRILGQNNFSYLSKKLGIQKVLMNYSLYEMLLNQGDSAKDIVQITKMQQGNKTSSNHTSNDKQKQGNKKQEKKIEQIEDYISRKQIIQITISKCLTMMKNMHPETQITIVYFNDNIQIPVDFFNQKITIAGIQGKNVEQMIQLGVDYSTKISKAKASNIGQNLIMNLTKAQQGGTTALGPALAFCFGLAKAFKYSLHQIVVITDGVSNVGFGQTDNELQHELGKKFYEQLALEYAKPLNCVVDVIAFQDQCIGYDVVDQLVSITGGIPSQIQFTKLGGVNIVTDQTFNNISFKLSTAFTEYISKLNFQTQTIISCLNQNVKLKVQNQLTPFIQSDKGNIIVLKTGVKSSDYSYYVEFNIPPQIEQVGNSIKFMIINQYKKNNKKYITLITQKIKIVKGTKEQAEKQQAVALQKQIRSALTPRQIFEEDINQYKKISMKIEECKNVEKNLDQQLVQKFKMKKQKLEEDMKSFDKFTREKLTMKSRAQKTFKRDKLEDDDDDWK